MAELDTSKIVINAWITMTMSQTVINIKVCGLESDTLNMMTKNVM